MQTIIVISPDTFGYYRAILRAIEHRGDTPIWLNQLPSTSVFSRVLFRLAPYFARRLAKRHFERELDRIEGVDQILIIKGEGVSDETIASMRRRYPCARIIFYLWDSIANTTGAEQKIELCDAAFSFDPEDCDRIKRLKHLPLFHTNVANRDTKATPRHGFAAFVGTLHSNRYQMISAVGCKIEEINSIKPFIYFYYPSKLLFTILKIINSNFRRVKPADVNFHPVPRDQYAAIQNEAQILIDICHPRQSGLTMRTIEALGGGKKLITNNSNIRRYEFFCPENFYVVEDASFTGLQDFLAVPYRSESSNMTARYHIDSWLATLLVTEGA